MHNKIGCVNEPLLLDTDDVQQNQGKLTKGIEPVLLISYLM